MCASFSDDDVGKTVVNANGDEVGIVSAVEHGSARVKPNPGVADTIKAKLGWSGTTEDTYPLQEEAVEHVTDDEIRLEGDLGDTGTMGTGTDHAGAGTGTGTGSGMGDDDDELLDTDIGDDSHGDRMGDDDGRMRDDAGRMDNDDDELLDTDIGDDSHDSRMDDDDDELLDTDIGDDDDDSGIAGTDIGSDSDRDDRDRDTDSD